MLSTFISISLALVINFYIPEIPENKKFIITDSKKDKIIKSFPYQYFQGEVLTDEIVRFRTGLIYISFMIFFTVSLSVSPLVIPIISEMNNTPLIEQLVPNQSSSKTNQRELLLELRGGNSELSEFIIKILLIWTMARNCGTTQGFMPNPINHHHFGPNGRTAPKLVENPANPGQGSCKAKRNRSMDEISNSLSPEYVQYQQKYVTDSLEKRFNTNEYSIKEFKELARVPNKDGFQYTRTSIDEARAICQAELENIVIKPSRIELATAKRVDLDFKVEGPDPFTHIDVKTPVGSEILKKQGRTISIEEMSNQIGKKIVKQKHTFVGRENGPVSPENVGHIVDLCYVPNSEKPIIKENILKGALESGSDKGIIFLNDI